MIQYKESTLVVEVTGTPTVGYTARIIDVIDGGNDPVGYLKSFGVKTEAFAQTGWEALALLAKQMGDAGCMD